MHRNDALSIKVHLNNQLILLILAVLNCDTRVHPHLRRRDGISLAGNALHEGSFKMILFAAGGLETKW